MKTRMSVSRCCCGKCGDVYWSVSGTSPNEESRYVTIDGDGLTPVFIGNNSGHLEFGRTTKHVYNWGSSGGTVWRTPCKGTDALGTHSELMTVMSGPGYALDDAGEYLYWLSGQSGTQTTIFRRAYGSYPATAETVVVLDSSAGDFSGLFAGTFLRIRYDEPTGLIYLTEDIGSLFSPAPWRTFCLDLSAPSLTDISPYNGGDPRPTRDFQVVSGSHIYGIYINGTVATLARFDVDGTDWESIDTNDSGLIFQAGFRGIAVTSNEQYLLTMRWASSNTYDLVRYDLSDFSDETIYVNACTSTNQYLGGPVTRL